MSRLKPIFASLMLSTAIMTPITTAPAYAFPFSGGIVLDPSNLAQNILTATQSLQQINNQIRQLHNEAEMLINDAKNLTKAGYNPAADIQRILNRINALMGRAKSIEYTISETNRVFKGHYPEDYTTWTESKMGVAAEAQWKISRNAFHDALLVQAEIVQSVKADSATLDRLLGETMSAEGALSVAQTGNQIMAMDAKQSLQMQQLMAAQYRAEAVERARRLQIERESKVRTARFVGGGSAYTTP